MKTLQECKDEVARKRGYYEWESKIFENGEVFVDELFNEAAELYASQFKETVVGEQKQEDLINSWKESMKAAKDHAIEMRDHDEVNEAHYSAYQEAIEYATEMMDKHLAIHRKPE